MNVTIHGQEIALEDVEPDEVVTDVMILMRTVRHNDEDGRLQDAITIGCTTQTTGMIQRGMLDAADGITADHYRGRTWNDE